MLVIKFILTFSFKLNSINKYAKPNIKGIEINVSKINNIIFFCLKKIWNLEIIIKNTIANTTGIEEGLEANNKNMIIESSK
tara:strand:+ start:280 stop:522 length:243 start_codon:yes stop_codon:yes gene_type:complete